MENYIHSQVIVVELAVLRLRQLKVEVSCSYEEAFRGLELRRGARLRQRRCPRALPTSCCRLTPFCICSLGVHASVLAPQMSELSSVIGWTRLATVLRACLEQVVELDACVTLRSTHLIAHLIDLA